MSSDYILHVLFILDFAVPDMLIQQHAKTIPPQVVLVGAGKELPTIWGNRCGADEVLEF